MKYYKKIDFTHVYSGREAADLFKDAENRRTLIGVYKLIDIARFVRAPEEFFEVVKRTHPSNLPGNKRHYFKSSC